MVKNVNFSNDKIFFSTGLRWLWIVPFILAVDLYSKFLINKHFYLGKTTKLFSWLNLCYVRNYGAAFSFLANKSGWQHWFFISTSTVICIIQIFLMHQLKATQKIESIAYALIIGGGISNLLDRLWHGFVIDMIDCHIGNWHFATFNIADSFIFIGTMLIIVDFFTNKIIKKRKK